MLGPGCTEPPDSLIPFSSASSSSYSSTSSFPLLRGRSLSPLQQPFQTADAIFSGSWQSPVGEARWGGCCWPVLVASPRKKRAPRGRSLGPSNWRRCPSTGARAIASLSLFSLVPPSFRLRPPTRACLFPFCTLFRGGHSTTELSCEPPPTSC